MFYNKISFTNRAGETRLCCVKRISCDKAGISMIMDFQENVLLMLDDKSLCMPLSRKEWLYLAQNGFIEAAFYDGELVYLIGCLYPDLEHNLGADLALSQEILPAVAHLEIAMTRPDFRGFGLHSQMLIHCVELLALDGRTKIICSTVSPDNSNSLKALQAAGLKIALEKEKYGGKRRYIMRRDLF